MECLARCHFLFFGPCMVQASRKAYYFMLFSYVVLFLWVRCTASLPQEAVLIDPLLNRTEADLTLLDEAGLCLKRLGWSSGGWLRQGYR